MPALGGKCIPAADQSIESVVSHGDGRGPSWKGCQFRERGGRNGRHCDKCLLAKAQFCVGKMGMCISNTGSFQEWVSEATVRLEFAINRKTAEWMVAAGFG